ncbi:hypothetical protein HB662_14265 [Roseomonas frigidaquae]|uniref:Uncharacterized protein n=1 Tax=Falsiroseomonas frigidaquae TaxID=487318 RepID=A0ABX1F0X0_9PROT|nr:hypothetical protein [Falsiroseomonas frigidaquae]NKE45952.1 hypothetical protein [Falsiroseomonas frigidaquae]
MNQVARITLFVHDRAGRLETLPDPELLRALLQETPLVTRHDDGSRTFVFDMVEPEHRLSSPHPRAQVSTLESLRLCGAALASAARSLGLPLTAALAESAELVAQEELRAMQVPKRRQC